MSTKQAEAVAVDWVDEIGRPAYESIADMVRALECDYDRLEELREARDCWADDPERPGVLWADAYADDAEELAELESAAKGVGDPCESRDDAERYIQEDALSVEVRSDWTTPGEEMQAGEFCLLLATGGPAVRIRGELDQYGEPSRAWLEVQDWFKPWTQYHGAEQDTLLSYARCFVYTA